MFPRISLIVLLFMTISLSSTQAFAQYRDRDDNMRFEEDFEKTEMGISGHIRLVAIPSFLTGAFYDDHSSTWSDGPNLAYGGEFLWRKIGDYEIMFQIDYADLHMASDLWRESGDPATEYYWTMFDLQLLSFVVATYFTWDVNEWFSPYVGGGIGPGFTLGEVTKYQVAPNGTCFNQGEFNPDGCVTNGEADLAGGFLAEEKEDIPFVLPVLNVSGGARFNIKKHAAVKLELGFHDYLYAGLSLGGQW